MDKRIDNTGSSYQAQGFTELLDDTAGVAIKVICRPGVARDAVTPEDHMLRIAFMDEDGESKPFVDLCYEHAKEFHAALGLALEKAERDGR